MLSYQRVLKVANRNHKPSCSTKVKDFSRLYNRKAHVHHYTEYMERGEFDEAFETVNALIKDYIHLDMLQLCCNINSVPIFPICYLSPLSQLVSMDFCSIQASLVRHRTEARDTSFMLSTACSKCAERRSSADTLHLGQCL